MHTPEKDRVIARRFQQINTAIRIAKGKVGRENESIRLVVVTKGQPIEAIRQVVEAGAVDLGENYLEEALQKMMDLTDMPALNWHMIGHVQRRKAKAVCQHFDWIHSVDSLKLCRRLDRFAGESGKRLPILLEYNVSGESSKFGWDAVEQESWPKLAEELSSILSLSNLEVLGLMTMAPFEPRPEATRPYFRRLKSLRDFFSVQFPENSFRELSMGMSQDYEIAIEEGATILRIGRAIMGERVG